MSFKKQKYVSIQAVAEASGEGRVMWGAQSRCRSGFPRH